ncbi:hypothetical protein ACQE3E_07810 [Methylomonas sp. MED-D]|uniref:hypothetical protein n=1 Tax=unclassified Methylomonas TaxID=2608980 RepID=UPI0028A40D5A|nr:hypothetical protein [Methylomonas sp. MV1]MDT4329184.1 hypothetical protein [Methylomonas sp. MV1]
MSILKKRLNIFLCIFFVFGIFTSIFNNDFVALSVHLWLNLYSEVSIGKVIIKKPANWIMAFKECDNNGVFSTGYFYGIVPAIFFQKNFVGMKYFYIFHDMNDKKKEVIFTQIDDKYVTKGKEAIAKFQDVGGLAGKFNIQDINGFKGIVIKSNDRAILYSVTIPDLSLYIMLNSMDDLKDFKLSFAENPERDGVCTPS